MFGSEPLDVAIGLIFTFLLLGLICSVVNELIARLIALRSRTLEVGIRNLLSGKDANAKEFSEAFYEHSLIKGLYRKGWFDKIFKRKGRPSYIPNPTFAIALLDILKSDDKTTSEPVKEFLKVVAALPESDMKNALITLIDGTEKGIEQVQKKIEVWFNNTMERITGWYKRKIQMIGLSVAIAITTGMNVDTFLIANSLYRDPTLRASIVASATEALNKTPETDTLSFMKSVKQIQGEIDRLGLPMGWSDQRYIPHHFGGWLKKIFGWLFTALAVSLGAPFWFDILSKIVQLRSTGKEIKTENLEITKLSTQTQ